MAHRSIANQVAREASELRRQTAATTTTTTTTTTNVRATLASSSESQLKLKLKPTASEMEEVASPVVDRGGALLEREQRNLCLLRKRSFNCMVVGGRQTGKRTIVKCFVKLLNEFKLAADEFKKEKMLSKLMECSERLNELTSQQEAAAQHEHSGRLGRRSRLNSWLPGGTTVNKLLHFSPKNKQRLHSVVGIWAPRDESSPSRSTELQQQQRRHTTFVHNTCASEMTVSVSATTNTTTNNNNNKPQLLTTSGSSRFLNVDQGNYLQSCTTNKSDTNVNYSVQQQERDDHQISVTVHQLKVPALNQTALRKHSDTTGHSSGGNFLSTGDKNNKGGPGAETAKANNYPASSARRHTDASAFNWHSSQANQTTSVESPAPRGQDGDYKAANLNAKRRISCRPGRKQSTIVGLTRRRRRMLLSLKELNRRRCGIKFKTRRQISEAYLEQLTRPVVEDIKRRASIMATNKNSLFQDESWPDAFLVVYSINDRDSFEYAKTLIGQLRANEQDVPLPIILVANKIDLERVRTVKREEGRSLARKNSCKFMELSCTVGFNLDNLLVGLRTQLILRHHIILNSILRGKSPRVLYKAKEIQRSGKDEAKESGSRTQQRQQQQKGSDNILIRFYKRYVMDNSEQNYDCDNFSKL